MKYLLIILFIFGAFNAKAQSVYVDREKRTEWFRHDRFGLFIHWGIYAIPA